MSRPKLNLVVYSARFETGDGPVTTVVTYVH